MRKMNIFQPHVGGCPNINFLFISLVEVDCNNHMPNSGAIGSLIGH